MRILKEYSALVNPVGLTEENSIALSLIPENSDNAVDYIEQITKETNISHKTLAPLKAAAAEIFAILAQNAGTGEETRLSCRYHRYYYMLVFEFSESALPLHTLNKSVKVLSSMRESDGGWEDKDIGFMNVVHLVNRITLTVDKITEKMRISIIKENKYPVLKAEGSLPKLDKSDQICRFDRKEGDVQLAYDFSKRLNEKFGTVCDKFLIAPQLLVDNLEERELEASFLKDIHGNALGGAVWQKTYGIIVLMVFTVFLPSDSEEYDHAVRLLLEEFERNVGMSEVGFVVSKMKHSQAIAEYFDSHDEVYYYKSTRKQTKQTSYIKPDLMPLIKKAYKSFEISRDVREINYRYNFIEPYSVLTAKIDAEASEAVLSIHWFGDDLKSNIIRHIIALEKIGIEKIYFRLDLGNPEEAAVSDLVQSCGFEAEYLWPYSSDKGDVVVFTYLGNSAYEMKPCIISPINKSNMDKTPALVRKVYGDHYPSEYLYEPQKLWEKIRKRQIYPFIAIDDSKEAVGMIAFVKFSANPYLFEIGKLMVDPESRGTNVVNQLIEYIYSTAIQNLDFDAVLSESVTNHKLSQRSCVNSGFCDTALKLNIMSATAFALEEERRRIGRMSCVVSCIERADEAFFVYLPKVYAQQIRFCFEGLKPRSYGEAKEVSQVQERMTDYHMDDDEAETSQLIVLTINSIGSDIEDVLEKLEQYAVHKGIKSMLVNIPLNSVDNAAVVTILRDNGFFFGGVMPYWFTDSDALLMQKLYENAPDWDSIKLYSRKIKRISEFIKKDMEAVGHDVR